MHDQAFTPEWLKRGEEETWPRFMLRAGPVLERDQFEAELEGRHRAGTVLPFQLLDVVVTGLRALLGPEEAAPLEELVRAEYGGEELSPADRVVVKGATDALAEHWPEYQAAMEQEARRNAVLPTLAFVRWCQGWENVTDAAGEPVDYVRDALGRIPDEVLRRVPFTAIRAVGMRAYGLQYGRTELKN